MKNTFKKILAALMAMMALMAGLPTANNNAGGGTDLILRAISEAAESEETEMAKTTDRIMINGEDYLIQDSETKSAFNDLVSLVPIVGRRYFHLVVGSCHVAGTSIYVPSESTKVVMLQEILTRPSGIQFCFDDTIYELAYVTLSAEGISTGYYAWVGSTSPWTEPTPSSTPSYCTILLRRKDGGVFTGDPDTVLWQEEVEQNQIVAQRQLAESNAAAYTDEQIRNKVREIPAGFVQYGFPDGFSWTDNPVKDRVYTDGKGRFFVDYNVMDHVSTEGLDVYMAADGNNANDGLTAETPKLTLAAAIGITNARRVHIAGGYYPREEITLSADIDLIGDPDNRAVFTGQNASTAWAATSTSGVYTTAHKNYGKVYDLTDTSGGTYRQYTEVQSVEAVQAAEGTYYDDGTTVTIHTYSNAEPTLDKVCYAQGWSAFRILLNGHTALIAHLSFTCSGTYSGRGQLMLVGDDTSRGAFLMYNCDSSYSIRPAGDNISGGSAINPQNADGIIQYCTAYHAGNDGFSYGAGCKIVEIGCASAYNGTDDITSCNGSTAHGGSYIRINGAYHDTHGPVVHDVGATESVNLGLAAWHSTCEGKPSFCASGGWVKMWLDSCVGYSSDAGIDVGKPNEPAPNAVIYKRNCTSDLEDGVYGGHIYRY